MGKIVVIGSTNTDMVVTSEKMPLPGETILGNSFDIIHGGKGANQAVASARADGEVAFVAKVGNDDFGRKTQLEFNNNKISTEHILIDEENPSGVALIIVNETTGQNSIVVAPGANGNMSVEDVMNAEDLIKASDILLVQLEIPLEAVQCALELAKKYGVKTILNPAPAQALTDNLLSKVDYITPNESETEILIGLNPTNDDTTEKAADLLLEKINDTVIITLGSKGVYYKSKNGDAGYVNTDKVDAIDTTAAGDVFNGYFAAGLANEKSCIEAIKKACKAATLSVTRKGAQPSIPFKYEID